MLLELCFYFHVKRYLGSLMHDESIRSMFCDISWGCLCEELKSRFRTWDESSLFLLEVDPSFVTVTVLKYCNAVLGKTFVVQQLFWNKSILDQKRDSEKYQGEYTGIRWKSILSFVVLSKFTNWIVESNCCLATTFLKYLKVHSTRNDSQKDQVPKNNSNSNNNL